MAQPKKARQQAASEPSEEQRAQLAAMRERLLHSITLTTDRLQDAVDDAVRRGRMTRQDAEDLVNGLVQSGRSQTEALLADLEQLLGRSRMSEARRRATAPAAKVVDRAKRAVEAATGGFPIIDYDDLTAAQIAQRLGDLQPAELRKVRDYEKRNANRKSVLAAVDKALV